MSWKTLEIVTCCGVAVVVTAGAVSGVFEDAANKLGSHVGLSVLVLGWVLLLSLVWKEIRRDRE